jgi:hypothetical protein
MVFMPFDRFIIHTDFSVQQAQQRLSEAVRPPFSRVIFMNVPQKYEGRIHGNRFEISRITNYRDTFLPVVVGTIRDSVGSCSIDVRLRPHVVVIGALLVILGLAIAAECGFFLTMLNARSFNISIFWPAAVLLVFYVISTVWFKMEATAEKQNLNEIFGPTKDGCEK